MDQDLFILVGATLLFGQWIKCAAHRKNRMYAHESESEKRVSAHFVFVFFAKMNELRYHLFVFP